MLRALVTSPASTKRRSPTAAERKSLLLAALAGVVGASPIIAQFVGANDVLRATRSAWNAVAGLLDDEMAAAERELSAAKADLASYEADLARAGDDSDWRERSEYGIRISNERIEAAEARIAEIQAAERELSDVEVDE